MVWVSVSQHDQMTLISVAKVISAVAVVPWTCSQHHRLQVGRVPKLPFPLEQSLQRTLHTRLHVLLDGEGMSGLDHAKNGFRAHRQPSKFWWDCQGNPVVVFQIVFGVNGDPPKFGVAKVELEKPPIVLDCYHQFGKGWRKVLPHKQTWGIGPDRELEGVKTGEFAQLRKDGGVHLTGFTQFEALQPRCGTD